MKKIIGRTTALIDERLSRFSRLQCYFLGVAEAAGIVSIVVILGKLV